MKERNPAMPTKALHARRLGRLAALAAVLGAAACITVNMNFPESAVQEAANSFVHDLYKADKSKLASDDASAAANDAAAVKSSVKKGSKKKKGKAPAAAAPGTEATPASAPAASPAPAEAKPTSMIPSFGIASAYAIEVDTSTPGAQKIKARMAGRVDAIQLWKTKGVLCETEDGMLDIQDAGKAGDRAGEVSKLMKAENADRDELYAEIQQANRISDPKQTKIRKFFAAAFREHSPPACK